jgi:hypothetical protein
MRAWQWDRRNPSPVSWPSGQSRMCVVSCARALLWVLTGCLWWTVAAGAEPLCPPGPFETNRDTIASRMAAMPVTFSSQEQSSTPPEQWTLTDGVVWKGGGGLQIPRKDGLPYGSTGEEAYDAKRYIERYVSDSWVMYPAKEPTYPPQHLVETYSTTIVRPTPEEAREIACLVNQLLRPKSEEPRARTETPPPEGVIGNRMSRCVSPSFSDGYWESLRLRTSTTGVSYGAGLSCAAIGALERRLTVALRRPLQKKSSSPPREH